MRRTTTDGDSVERSLADRRIADATLHTIFVADGAAFHLTAGDRRRISRPTVRAAASTGGRRGLALGGRRSVGELPVVV